MWIYFLFVFCWFLNVTVADVQTDICHIPEETCGPFIPPLSKSYMAKVEVTDTLENKTSYAVEYFDGDNLRGVLTSKLEGNESRIIYDASKKMLFTLRGWDEDPFKSTAECEANDFIYNRDNFVVGVSKRNGEKFYFILGGGLLHYNPDLRFEYKPATGPTIVRGMAANMWEGCLYLAHVDGTFRISYYWSDPTNNMPTPSGEKSVPLKTVVTGQFRPNPDNLKEYKFVNIITNFIWFQSNPVLSDELFQLPFGVFCKNDPDKQDFPPLPSAFSVGIETQLELNEKKKKVDNYDMWYDKDSKLLRMDYWTPDVVELRTIYDYNTDVIYTIDNLSNCSFTSMHLPDENYTPKVEDIFLPMLFSKTDNMTYLGKFAVRDRLCDVWSGASKDDSTQLDWSFLDSRWHETEEGNKLVTRIPVQSVKTQKSNVGSKTDYRLTVNYFHFRPTSDEEFPFDIGSCFENQGQRKFFQIAFPGFQGVDLKVFAKNCRLVIAYSISSSPLRVVDVQAEYFKKRIYVEFSVLAPNPSSSGLPLLEVANKLKNAVVTNAVMVRLKNSPLSEAQYLTALPDTFLELDIRDPCSVTTGLESKSHFRKRRSVNTNTNPVVDRYSKGQISGIGFGLFGLGFLLGIVGMILLLRTLEKRGNQRRPSTSDQIQLEESYRGESHKEEVEASEAES